MPNEKNLLAHAPTQPAMAAQPPTRALPAMTDRAMLEDLYKLNKGQTETLAKQTSALTNLAANVDTLSGQQGTIVSRLNGLEFRMGSVEERTNQNSMRAKLPSNHDLETAAELARTKTELVEEVAARTALADKVDSIEKKTDAQTKMLTTISGAVTGVKGFVKQNPGLVAAGVGLVSAICGWLTSFFQARGH